MPTPDGIKFLLDLVFPIRCQGCAAEGVYLCVSCQAKIKPPLQRCLGCHKNSPFGSLHPECQSPETALTGLWVAADYQEPSIQNLIWHLKYNSVAAISEVLALMLTDYFVTCELQDYFAGSAVVPVPLHKSRLRSRGFNQAELLGQKFSQRMGFQYLPVLEKFRNSRSQVDLERDERLSNVKGLFRATPTPSLGERKVILVDDVAATGATLNECAKVLKAQGAGEIWGLVVARN